MALMYNAIHFCKLRVSHEESHLLIAVFFCFGGFGGVLLGYDGDDRR